MEIIAYSPTTIYHCTNCEAAWREIGATDHFHEEQMFSSLSENLIIEYKIVPNWVREMFRMRCDSILLKVIDPASIEWFYKSLKHNAEDIPQ